MSPSNPPGTVLYTAELSKTLRVIQRVGLALGAVIALGSCAVLIVFALVLASGPEEATNTAIILVLTAVLGLAVIGLLVLSGWRASRMSLIVTTAGIQNRGWLRDEWIPWEQIARVEQSGHWYWIRAAAIVLRDGRRIISIITAYQYLIFRGEPYDAMARNPHIPLLPTRIAIDVHQRFLRGEFASVR